MFKRLIAGVAAGICAIGVFAGVSAASPQPSVGKTYAHSQISPKMWKAVHAHPVKVGIKTEKVAGYYDYYINTPKATGYGSLSAACHERTELDDGGYPLHRKMLCQPGGPYNGYTKVVYDTGYIAPGGSGVGYITGRYAPGGYWMGNLHYTATPDGLFQISSYSGNEGGGVRGWICTYPTLHPANTICAWAQGPNGFNGTLAP